MKNSTATLATLSLLAAGSFAAEKPAADPHSATLTFYLGGVECPSCIYSVWQSVNEVKGVADAELQQRIDSFANVTFDTRVASAQQIAQAVTDAIALHGKPYDATLRMRVPDYPKNGNAARVDAVFARHKQWVKIEALDKTKGEFVLSFLPLKLGGKKAVPQGWNPDAFTRALHDPAPKGLGLDVQFEKGE